MGLLSLLLGGCQRQPSEPFVVAEYLVVGGGGFGGYGDDEGGSFFSGGGGGAGGLLTGARSFPKGVSTNIEVGIGAGFYPVFGVGNLQFEAGDSTLGDIVAFAGGDGGNAIGGNGQAGGSGGGGGSGDGGGIGGAGVSGQGTSGGNGSSGGSGSGGSLNESLQITGEFVDYARGGVTGVLTSTGYAAPPANTGNGGGGQTQYLGELEVEGAGVEDLNGVYTRSPDSFNGRPQWIRLRQFTSYEIRWFNSNWRLGEASVAFYTLGDDEELPDFEGIVAVSEAYEPVPTIAEQVITDGPQNGASGVVIIAVPGDPPATATGTYTKSTSSRPGYAVYRWTDGEGSIVFN